MDAPAQTGKRVLVVDDDPSFQVLIPVALRALGVTTLVAANGEEAQALLARETVDLVLVDLLMPVMDGMRFLQWLRQEAKLAVPAIVLSSATEGVDGTSEHVRRAGADAILRKPVQLEELRDTVRRFLA